MEIIELPPSHTKNCQFVHNRYEAVRKLPSGSVIAEVGVLAGDFSEWILRNLAPRELHLVDIFDCADFPHRSRFTRKGNESFVRSRFKDESKVKIHKGVSWEVLKTFPESFFDWIYIDAAHDYNSVKKDLETARLKLKDGGWLAVNDYILFDHLVKEPYGVVQATNEFCMKYNWEFRYFAFHPQLFCDVILTKIQPRK